MSLTIPLADAAEQIGLTPRQALYRLPTRGIRVVNAGTRGRPAWRTQGDAAEVYLAALPAHTPIPRGSAAPTPVRKRPRGVAS